MNTFDQNRVLRLNPVTIEGLAEAWADGVEARAEAFAEGEEALARFEDEQRMSTAAFEASIIILSQL